MSRRDEHRHDDRPRWPIAYLIACHLLIAVAYLLSGDPRDLLIGAAYMILSVVIPRVHG